MRRHKVLERILSLEPEPNHQAFVYLDNCYEFPFDIPRAVEFALFRAYAVPVSPRCSTAPVNSESDPRSAAMIRC